MATQSSATKAGAAKATPAGEATAEGADLLRIHHLRPARGAKTARTRVGRGEGGKGKTAGRGTKGSKARGSIAANLEGGSLPMHMRMPKLRGFVNRSRVEYQVVNLDKLAALYPDGGEVTPLDLAARGAVRRGRPVKILGTGKATAAWQVSAHAFSKTATEKITAAGGSVNEP
jgi:large subunit ribosomal protein L15